MSEGIKNTLMGMAKKQRRLLRRSRQQWAYKSLSLQNAPVLFANSFPKSGTHLLTQILDGFPLIGPAVNSGLPAIVMYDGATGEERAEAAIKADLSVLSNGDTSYGHLHALPWIQSILAAPGFATFFILRDPRDVVVSHVHYVTDIEPNHVHHEYYSQNLHTFEERLKTSILGRPDAQHPFPDIAGRFAPFMGWLEKKQVLTLKYEALMAEPRAMTNVMLDFAVERGFPLAVENSRAVDILLSGINPQKSPTFRKGKSGGWVNAFSRENKALFKETAGELLIKLGYEKDYEW